jgi:hypothetical protein
MSKLCSIFDRHAPGETPEGAAGAEQAASSGSGANGKALTFEYRDTPFISFMRRVKDMIQTDPKEALRLIMNAKEAKLFVRAHEKERIKEAMTRIIDALRREHPQGLTATFFRSALDLPPPVPEHRQPHLPVPALRPLFPIPGLTPAAAPI